MLDKSHYEMYSEYCEITKRELKRGDKKLREYLKRIREEKGLTQQYIAEKLEAFSGDGCANRNTRF